MAHGGERKKLIPFFAVHDYLELKLLFKMDHLIKYQILKCLARIYFFFEWTEVGWGIYSWPWDLWMHDPLFPPPFGAPVLTAPHAGRNNFEKLGFRVNKEVFLSGYIWFLEIFLLFGFWSLYSLGLGSATATRAFLWIHPYSCQSWVSGRSHLLPSVPHSTALRGIREARVYELFTNYGSDI